MDFDLLNSNNSGLIHLLNYNVYVLIYIMWNSPLYKLYASFRFQLPKWTSNELEKQFLS